MKGMSKRESLKEVEVIQIHIFPNEEGAWHFMQKKTVCFGPMGFAVACHWNTTEPKEFCGLRLSNNIWVQCPQGSKKDKVESIMK